MDLPLAKFSIDQINTILAGEGIFPSDENYATQFADRYYRLDCSEDGKPLFAERDDWHPGSMSVASAIAHSSSGAIAK